MNVCGIDLSSHAIDIVKVPLDTDRAPEWHRFPLTGSDAFDRARSVRDAMPCRTSIFWDDTLAIGVEDPRGHGAGHIYRVQGSVLACLPPHLLVHPLIPSAWRKLVGLKGNAPHADYCRLSDDLLGPGSPDWPEDAHAAHLIARATRTLITTPKEKAA